MSHCFHKCTETIYDYAIINYEYLFGLMYELKKLERCLVVNLLGWGPRPNKSNLPARDLSKFETAIGCYFVFNLRLRYESSLNCCALYLLDIVWRKMCSYSDNRQHEVLLISPLPNRFPIELARKC
jgi:hypothetical protein